MKKAKPTTDPIWAVIEQHRAARAAYNKRVAIEITASGNIPDGADEEVLAAGRSLLTMRPTTLPGVIAVLRYVRSLAGPLSMLPGIVPATETVDPIFAAIEAHRRAAAVWDAALDKNDEAKETAAHDRLVQAGVDLLNTGPATVPGIITAIQYMRAQMLNDGTYMPHHLKWDGVGDAKETKAWIDAFLATLVATIAGREQQPTLPRSETAIDPIFLAIEAHRNAWNDSEKAQAMVPDAVRLRQAGIDESRARAEEAEGNRAAEPFYDAERAFMWNLIWTVPTTAHGLAALLRYCREGESINELVRDDEMEDVLEWTLECAACALAGLPKPPMSDVVADAWESRQEDASEEA
jgi:hypothetical protein